MPFSSARIDGLTIVQDGKIPAFEDALICENIYQSEDVVYVNRWVGRTEDNLLILMYFNSRVEDWSWDDIAVIANLQAQKVREF